MATQALDTERTIDPDDAAESARLDAQVTAYKRATAGQREVFGNGRPMSWRTAYLHAVMYFGASAREACDVAASYAPTSARAARLTPAAMAKRGRRSA